VDGSQHRGNRVGAIVLGLLAIAAGVVWTLFWGLAGVWEWPYFGSDLPSWLFFSAAFAVGIFTCLVGVFLLLGRYPGRRGWLVVGAVALVPFAPVIIQGHQAQEHVAAVTDVAEQAYMKRSGLGNVAADCIWEYDDEGYETWRCDMGPAAANDSCFVDVTKRNARRLIAEIDRCEHDEAQVNGVVERAYVKRSGLATVEADCHTYDAAGSESWRCELGPTADDDYCFVAIARRDGGRVSARISHCEREIMAAVNSVYTKRTRLGNVTAKCVEDEDEKWTCDMGPAADHDSCVVTLTTPDKGRVSARISYCEREVAAAVNRLVGRMYTKRTGIGNVTAKCALDKPGDWTCDMGPAADHDRCSVAIEMREVGPRVTYWATTCESGRL